MLAVLTLGLAVGALLIGPGTAWATWAATQSGTGAAQAVLLQPPSGFTAVCTIPGSTTSNITLNWTKSPTLSGATYKIVRTGTSGGTSATISVGAVATFMDSSLLKTKGASYTYTMQALAGAWLSTSVGPTVARTYTTSGCA